MFNKEFKFTCQRCGCTWYATSDEIKQSKKLKKDINLMNATLNITKASRLGIPTRKVQRQTLVLSEMQQAYNDPERCPDCGSRKVSKSKDKPKITL